MTTYVLRMHASYITSIQIIYAGPPITDKCRRQFSACLQKICHNMKRLNSLYRIGLAGVYSSQFDVGLHQVITLAD